MASENCLFHRKQPSNLSTVPLYPLNPHLSIKHQSFLYSVLPVLLSLKIPFFTVTNIFIDYCSLLIMAPITYLHLLKVAVTVGFIFSLTFLPSNSGYSSSENLKEREMVLGSKPPGCENKCLNCRPCIATLVIPSHEKRKGFMSASSSRGEDDGYYLLSWKCRCGNKLYQP